MASPNGNDNPLAQFGVPAVQSTASPDSNPLSSLGVPAVAANADATGAAPQSTLSKVGGAVASAGQSLDDATTGVQKGFAKGVGDTVSGISHLINKIPVVGETLAPTEGMNALDASLPAKGVYEHIGKGLEDVSEFALGDAALDGVSTASKLVAMAKKYPIIADTLNLATQHPWLAKIISEGAKGVVTGGAQGGVKGAQTGDATGGAEKGAAIGGALGAAGGAVSGAVDAVKNLRINPFRKSLDAVKAAVTSPLASPAEAGEAAAQPVAQAGVRAVAPPVGASFRSGIDVATPLNTAKNLYKTVDDASGTDFKRLYEVLDSAQDDAREAAPGSPEEAKAQLNFKNTQDAIDDAKKIAAQSGVPDVDKVLARADAKYAETQANKDFNSKFFGSQSVISGNVAHGDPETINVKSAINVLENFDKPNRYGISRLQQTSLGPNGAAALKQVLYDAKKAGQTAIDARALRNQILTIGGLSAGAIEGLNIWLGK